MNKKLRNYISKHDISNHENHPWFDGTKIYPTLLNKHIQGEHYLINVSDDNLGCVLQYHYEEDKGYYKKQNYLELNSMIRDHMPIEIRKPWQWKQVIEELKFNFAKGFHYYIGEIDADDMIINFKNGILDLKTGKLMPYSSEILSTIQIPCDYRSELSLSDAPVFSKFLDDITSGEEELKMFLLEYMGAILSNVKGYRYKKMLILTGLGNTGKSQLRELIISLVGKSNCHSIDLKTLNDRFGTSQIYGKRLVGSGDMSYTKIDEMDKIKKLTGGDDLNAEFKGKDGFSFKYGGFMLFVCNDLPPFGGDQGIHVYKRFIIVPCQNVIPLEQQDHMILDKMLKEKEAIVSTAIKYYTDTVKRGYEFTEGPIILRAREDYMRENNNICEFIDSNCNMTHGSIKRSTFYREYTNWCYRNSIKNVLGKKAAFAFLEREYGLTAAKKTNGEMYYPFTFKTF